MFFSQHSKGFNLKSYTVSLPSCRMAWKKLMILVGLNHVLTTEFIKDHVWMGIMSFVCKPFSTSRNLYHLLDTKATINETKKRYVWLKWIANQLHPNKISETFGPTSLTICRKDHRDHRDRLAWRSSNFRTRRSVSDSSFARL